MQQPNNKSQKVDNIDLFSDLLRSIRLTQDLEQTVPGKNQILSEGEYISLLIDIMNCLFSLIQLPLSLRPVVIVLIGASNGSTDWFELSDKRLGARLLGDPEEDGNSWGALKKRMQRCRQALKNWQDKTGYKIVEIDTGFVTHGKDREGKTDKTKKEYHLTRYRLPILPIIVVILRDALSGKRWNSYDLMKSQIEEHVKSLRGYPFHPDSGGYENKEKQISRLKGMGVSAIIKSLKLCNETNGIPSLLLKDIIRKIENEAKKIIGDAPDLLSEENAGENGDCFVP